MWGSTGFCVQVFVYISIARISLAKHVCNASWVMNTCDRVSVVLKFSVIDLRTSFPEIAQENMRGRFGEDLEDFVRMFWEASGEVWGLVVEMCLGHGCDVLGMAFGTCLEANIPIATNTCQRTTITPSKPFSHLHLLRELHGGTFPYFSWRCCGHLPDNSGKLRGCVTGYARKRNANLHLFEIYSSLHKTYMKLATPTWHQWTLANTYIEIYRNLWKPMQNLNN